MNGLGARYGWSLRPPAPVSAELAAAAHTRGLADRFVRLLAARGMTSAEQLAGLLDEPLRGLHDPRRLPDADVFARRVGTALERGERVLVFGDFDADGLTGLACLVLALRRLGLDAAPYVPDRSEEGHGLSLAAVELARAEDRQLVITVDTGTSSIDEIAAARAAGIDVLVTDHHRVTAALPAALAVVNPHRPGASYPERELAGAGVAFKLAQLLLGDAALELADLAAIGTIADVAPLVGENRAIVRLGLDRLRRAPRPGLAALLSSSDEERARLDVDGIAYGLAPRLNAIGRVGDAALAGRLLLTNDPLEAAALADQLRTANSLRRELTAGALAEARASLEGSTGPVAVTAGEWPIGIIGLVAGRLAEERGVPAVVFSTLAQPWRGSARSGGDFDLAAAFAGLADLFERYGGHSAAAGCQLPAANYAEFERRFAALADGRPPTVPTLVVDLVVDALDVDYRLQRELVLLEPTGAGNPAPLVGIRGLTVARARPAAGGHTQLVLRKGREVVDGICFGRDDLVERLTEGDAIDVLARLASRTFGGYESIQLEVRDVAPAGALAALSAGQPAVAHA
jgi:single-stranded-DNA-specific exonuclease